MLSRYMGKKLEAVHMNQQTRKMPQFAENAQQQRKGKYARLHKEEGGHGEFV